MGKVSDEMIMAWVDGELDENQAGEVDRAIQSDPEARARAEVFRSSAAMLRNAFDHPAQQEVPAKLIRTIRQYPSPGTDGRTRNPLTMFFSKMMPSPAYALALVIVLCCGVIAGYLASSTAGLSPSCSLLSVVPSGVRFSRGLETTPSGKAFMLADGRLRVTPIVTFRDKSRQFCRQYELAVSQDLGQGLAQGVACRDESGQWHSKVFVPSQPKGAPSGNESEYLPAGGDELLDDVVQRLMGEPPLTLKQESAVMLKGWH